VPLADPLCGSGTLLIEAVAMALGQPPGLDALTGEARPLALQRWSDFDPALWQHELEAARNAGQAGSTGCLSDGTALAPVWGRDADAAVVSQARANAEDAGVAPWLNLQSGDCRSFEPPPGAGILVCNPPYGARLGAGEHDELEQLYADLGTMVKERCSGWTLWLLSGNPELTGALRLKTSRRVPVSNGGIDCRWLRYDIR
jgi:putative N6-adenine-specific DNA methylase